MVLYCYHHCHILNTELHCYCCCMHTIQRILKCTAYTALHWTELHCFRCAHCTFHRKCIILKVLVCLYVVLHSVIHEDCISHRKYIVLQVLVCLFVFLHNVICVHCLQKSNFVIAISSLLCIFAQCHFSQKIYVFTGVGTRPFTTPDDSRDHHLSHWFQLCHFVVVKCEI